MNVKKSNIIKNQYLHLLKFIKQKITGHAKSKQNITAKTAYKTPYLNAIKSNMNIWKNHRGQHFTCRRKNCEITLFLFIPKLSNFGEEKKA